MSPVQIRYPAFPDNFLGDTVKLLPRALWFLMGETPETGGQVSHPPQTIVMEVKANPVSEDAKAIFSSLMSSDNRVDISMAKDGEVFIVSNNGKFSTWTPLNGNDWTIILPSMEGIKNS